MPRFQGSLTMPQQSREWVSANRETIFAPNMAALKQAFRDAGQEAPDFARLQLHTGKVDLPKG
jgi:limonene 1,2-monooxygenase